MREVGERARAASRVACARRTTRAKNAALRADGRGDRSRRSEAARRERADVAAARAAGSDAAFVDRLTLDPERRSPRWPKACARSRRCPIPSARSASSSYRPTGIQVGQMRVPLGVVGIIYESRPNVTADAAALCLKSGNACILRGGSEALHSQPGDRGLRARGSARRRPAGGRGAGDRDHRPRRRRPAGDDGPATSTCSCRAAARA